LDPHAILKSKGGSTLRTPGMGIHRIATVNSSNRSRVSGSEAVTPFTSTNAVIKTEHYVRFPRSDMRFCAPVCSHIRNRAREQAASKPPIQLSIKLARTSSVRDRSPGGWMLRDSFSSRCDCCGDETHFGNRSRRLFSLSRRSRTSLRKLSSTDGTFPFRKKVPPGSRTAV
jgi:hypothetical protein